MAKLVPHDLEKNMKNRGEIGSAVQAGGPTCLDRWTFRGVQPISWATISSVIGPW